MADPEMDQYDSEIADQLRAEAEYDSELIGMEPIPVMFEKTVERHGDRPAQRYKGGIYDRSLASADAVEPAPDGEYAALSYDETRDVVRKLATGFRALGIGVGDRVGIFSQTRMEWAQADMGLLAAGAVVTTVYESSSPQQVQYLLNDPGASGVVVQNQELLERMLDVIDVLEVRFIAVVDDIDEKYEQRDGIYTLGEVYRQGARRYDPDTYGDWLDELSVDDLATLVYTSGTTGKPKGVRLTHRNLRAMVNQSIRRVGPRPERPADAPRLDADTQTVSYLPLAHVFERTVGNFVVVGVGGCIAYAESVDTLKEDFQAVEPNIATSVPRVYQKIYDAIRDDARETEVAGYPLGEKIFEWAVEVGKEYERDAQPGGALSLKMKLADRLVFSNVREALGGNVDMLVSGGGTLPKDLCTLYHGMGLPISEGYGLTETTSALSFNTPEHYRSGTIGVPIHGVDVRIDESVVPEGEFQDALGEFGELLVDGPNVTDGYWNMPEKTEEVFTDDGYFRTGDIVQRRPDGYLVFRERSKQILVLSTGKNVAPSPIEDGFSGSEVVEQCLVIGDGRKFISALIVPNFDRIRRAADEEGVDVPADPEGMGENEHVQAVVQREIDRVNQGFETVEQIKAFRLVPEEWTEENDLLTPSKKKKRSVIHDEYGDLIDGMYEAASEAEAQPPAETPASE